MKKEKKDHHKKDDHKTPTEQKNPVDHPLLGVLSLISEQLERLIICQEKSLSGDVYKDFNSMETLVTREGQND